MKPWRSFCVRFCPVLGLFVVAGIALYGYGASRPDALTRAVSSGEILRLHILADNDGDEAQQTKLFVRDAVLAQLAPALENAASSQEAEQIVTRELPLVVATARRAAAARGFAGDVAASVGVSSFPDKVYDGHLVPAGEYRALKITLGEGKGHNWWCVMYPPLCFVGEECTGLSDIEFESSLYKLYLRLKARWEGEKTA